MVSWSTPCWPLIGQCCLSRLWLVYSGLQRPHWLQCCARVWRLRIPGDTGILIATIFKHSSQSHSDSHKDNISSIKKIDAQITRCTSFFWQKNRSFLYLSRFLLRVHDDIIPSNKFTREVSRNVTPLADHSCPGLCQQSSPHWSLQSHPWWRNWQLLCCAKGRSVLHHFKNLAVIDQIIALAEYIFLFYSHFQEIALLQLLICFPRGRAVGIVIVILLISSGKLISTRVSGDASLNWKETAIKTSEPLSVCQDVNQCKYKIIHFVKIRITCRKDDRILDYC